MFSQLAVEAIVFELLRAAKKAVVISGLEEGQTGPVQVLVAVARSDNSSKTELFYARVEAVVGGTAGHIQQDVVVKDDVKFEVNWSTRLNVGTVDLSTVERA